MSCLNDRIILSWIYCIQFVTIHPAQPPKSFPFIGKILRCPSWFSTRPTNHPPLENRRLSKDGTHLLEPLRLKPRSVGIKLKRRKNMACMLVIMMVSWFILILDRNHQGHILKQVGWIQALGRSLPLEKVSRFCPTAWHPEDTAW